MELLADIPDDARWLLEALLEHGRGPAPSWAGLSAFHLLRTRPAQEHPAYGTALLQWQRMAARFGGGAPRLAAAAFLALPRTPREHGVAARVLELWSRHLPLPIELPGRLSALEQLPAAEAALVAEELALGAHECGAPSVGVLALVAGLPGQHLAEARALAQLERFARGEANGEALARALAPGLLDSGVPHLPELTARLLGGLSSPHAYVPASNGALDAVLTAVRRAAAACQADHPAAGVARRAMACVRELAAEDVLALANEGCAGEPAPTVGLPSAARLAEVLAGQPKAAAVKVVLRFPSLAGAAELGAELPGLTAWRAAREPEVAPAIARRARQAIPPARRRSWDSLAGGALPARPPPPPSWTEQLQASLRDGSELSRDALIEAGIDLSAVLFDSPGGPGLLGPEGMLRNGVRSWTAPKRLRVAHAVDLFDAERSAWQARLLASGARAPFNQLFRELYRAGGRELSRKRLERLRGSALTPGALSFLARRGWFPTLSPVEISPELHLGEFRARLFAEAGPAGPLYAGLELWCGKAPVLLAEVPPRLFSEACRDIDEALALALSGSSFVPVPARAELMRGLTPRLGLVDLRVEADHLAFRAGGRPERITLHNARPTSGAPGTEASARAEAAELLPFPDDGGVAALLLGRVLLRARDESPPAIEALAPPERS